MSEAIDVRFQAVLGKAQPGDTWTCVQLPGSAELFGPPAAIRRAIGKSDGDTVTVHLTERLN
jgi:hypothetical protein